MSLKNKLFEKKEDLRTEKERLVDRIFSGVWVLIVTIMVLYAVIQPVEFEGEISISSDVFGEVVKSVSPEKFGNISVNSSNGQNMIKIKGKAPLFSVVPGLFE